LFFFVDLISCVPQHEWHFCQLEKAQEKFIPSQA
jgi:hypothetical protein